MVDKTAIERICRTAGLVPETRANVRGAEIFIADGFSTPPHNAYRRFGVSPTDFPGGCYVTLWWAARREDKLDTGQPLFFETFHNPEYSREMKKKARIASALKEAEKFLARRTAHANVH